MMMASPPHRPRPRPIEGSVGSRIRVILGDTGTDYLLLLNEDDGNNQWQSRSWNKEIPHGAVCKQLNNLGKKGRYGKVVTFGPTGAWYIEGEKRDGTGTYRWWGNCDDDANDELSLSSSSSILLPSSVTFGTDDDGDESYVIIYGKNGCSYSNNAPQRLVSRMKGIRKREQSIHVVRLFHDDSYFIRDDRGIQWYGLGIDCEKELKKSNNAGGGIIHDVALGGDNTWIIIRDDEYISSQGVSGQLERELSKFYLHQRKRILQRKLEIFKRQMRDIHNDQIFLQRILCEAKEAKLEEDLRREVLEIGAREEQIVERKLALQVSLASLPPARRERVGAVTHTETDDANATTAATTSTSAVGSRSLTSTTTTTATKSSSSGRVECVVCQDRAASRAIVPCGHHCLCDICARQVVAGGDGTCPLCRGVVERTLKIYTSVSK